MQSVYLDLRESVTGRLLDSIRIEVTDANERILTNLARRNGLTLFVTRDGWNTSTYNRKTFDNLRAHFEVDYSTGTRLIADGTHARFNEKATRFTCGG